MMKMFLSDFLCVNVVIFPFFHDEFHIVVFTPASISSCALPILFHNHCLFFLDP